jgi:exosortase/archaeosortase family protein
MLMLVAAIVAFPMTIRLKVVGSIAGALLIYVVNVSRIVALWYCLRFWPSNFDSMHIIVGQTILVLVGVAYFAALARMRGGRLVQPSR